MWQKSDQWKKSTFGMDFKRTCKKNRGWALVLAHVTACALTNRREVNSVWEGDKIDVLEIIISAKISASNFGVLMFGISHAQW